MSDKSTVWITSFNYLTAQYDLYAVNSKKYDFAKNWKILNYQEKTDNPELLEIKKCHFKDALALERANHYFHKTDYLPDSLWVEHCNEALPESCENIFCINSGGILFNQACAELLQQFRLGESSLTPVQIYSLKTRQRCREDTYYFLNLCERRRYIQDPIVDDMFSSFPSEEKIIKYSADGDIENGQLLVKRAVLECELDLWHDPLLLGYVFISDALHDALVSVGLDRQLPMVFCQLV